jgi:hypothetical protein
MFTLGIDQDLISSRADLFGAVDSQIEAARLGAMKKMRSRLNTRLKRRLSSALNVPQKSLKNRLLTSRVEMGDEEMKIWFGTYKLSPFSVGTPTWYGQDFVSGGVKVGRYRTYRGAWLGWADGRSRQIWMRVESKHYKRELYPTSPFPAGGTASRPGMKGRFPVVKAAIEVHDEIAAMMEEEQEQIMEDFAKVFLQELNYQINVKGAGA